MSMQASTPYDELLHCVEVSGRTVTVNLEHSAGYTGPPAQVYVCTCNDYI